MKKIIIPIIIAAVLGVGGGVTAVMLNRPVTAEKNAKAPEVVTGNYYLDGDKDSGMYFELTDDYLALRIDGDAYTVFKEAFINEGYTEKDADLSAKDDSVDYCNENPYVISVPDLKTIPYQLMIHWTEGIVQDNGNVVYGGTGFTYNGYDTIRMFPFGEFILVD